jgi:hypothetical protein
MTRIATIIALVAMLAACGSDSCPIEASDGRCCEVVCGPCTPDPLTGAGCPAGDAEVCSLRCDDSPAADD